MSDNSLEDGQVAVHEQQHPTIQSDARCSLFGFIVILLPDGTRFWTFLPSFSSFLGLTPGVHTTKEDMYWHVLAAYLVS